MSLHLHPFLGIRCSHMRLVPNFLELEYKIWHEPSSTSLFLGIRCLHMRLVPNFLEQVCKIWHESPSTSLHFNAISEGSGETVLKCSLARSLAARKFDMFHEVALKFGLSCHLNPFFFRDSLLAYAISTNRS